MALPTSGPLSLFQIATEFGAPTPVSLFSLYRGGPYVPNTTTNQKVPTSGPISILNFYGAAKQLTLAVNTTRENLDLYTLFVQTYGTPSGPVNVVVTIGAVVIGGVNGNAITYGQFPAGSVITVNNYGSIQGQAGGPNFAPGGGAVYAQYPSQVMVFNNYGSVLAGGGGGGVGGTGGAGGTGVVNQQQNLGAGYLVGNSLFCQPNTTNTCGCAEKYGASATICADTCGTVPPACESCNMCAKLVAVYTTGGTGGGGGVGGYGQGYARDRTGGNPGAGGAAGGQNAGVGGQGGTGGTGGDWGQNGAGGATGNTGSNGNAGSGGAGAGGTAGGPAGNYIVKGSDNLTFNNQGTVAGGTA